MANNQWRRLSLEAPLAARRTLFRRPNPLAFLRLALALRRRGTEARHPRGHTAVTIIPVLSPRVGLDNEGTFETWLWGIYGIDAGSAWIIAQPIDGQAFGS
jgi:hypothetical protein